MGSSLALGLGAWMLFTLLWLLLTSVVAGLSGVAVDGSDVERWSNLQAQVDLFSLMDCIISPWKLKYKI